MKLFRRDNKEGFIKFFSSNPSALVSKYTHVKDVMKASYINHLMLYPRIRKEVKTSLSSDVAPNIKIFETEIAMSLLMI